MLRSTAAYLQPCVGCRWSWIFPFSNSSWHLDGMTSLQWAKYASISQIRWHSSLSDPKTSYVPSCSDTSLKDTVSLSRQGCDQTTNDEIIPKSNFVPEPSKDPDGKIVAAKEPSEKEKEKTRKWQEYTQPWIKPEGYDTGIKIFNSLTRQKEPLILPKGKVATW